MLTARDLEQIEALLREDDAGLYRRFFDRFARRAADDAPRSPAAAALGLPADDAAPIPSATDAGAEAAPNVRADPLVAPPSRRSRAGRPAAVEPGVEPSTTGRLRPADGLPSAAGELIGYSAQPATVAGTSQLIIDQFDWLQLTIGRFLAPAARDGESNRVVYWLQGREDLDGRVAIDELRAFAATLDRLHEHLATLIEEARSAAADSVLTSLRTVLELRLPDADAPRSCHLRDGVLCFTGWGLVRGVRMDSLLADGPVRAAYLGALRARLVPAAAPAAAADNDAPPPTTPRAGQLQSPPRTAPPPENRPEPAGRRLGVVSSVLITLFFLFVIAAAFYVVFFFYQG